MQEIGLCLALGIKSSTLLAAFLLKALVTGLAAGVIGVPLALLLVAALRVGVFQGHGPATLIDPMQVLGILVLMPVFAVLAAWLPSYWASRRDPAEVLRHD
jgi:ABC-type lipoprotein release transport system permease subunit